MKKALLASLIVLSFEWKSFAQNRKLEVVRPDFSESQKKCGSLEQIASEMLDLELRGLRAASAKRSCYENYKVKYVNKSKDPMYFAKEIKKIKTAKITNVKDLKKYYAYEVKFQVEDMTGETLKDSFGFIMLGDANENKPKRGGCATYAMMPDKTYVLESCL